ncbi:Thioredoxin-like 2-1, chloroplastic [Porphyridium purpureum]|uniref:Thioredoxin-like 2-1, chloroplastic n=1 Tax=Porphyridium purpureum TaxID=35688 RepID=A0A5J4YLT3_PORPP|nr:Thioredoxin-like 2-1, chloroplastic [Porphyridium purpureum]|eukprot:POR7672..scf244_11
MAFALGLGHAKCARSSRRLDRQATTSPSTLRPGARQTRQRCSTTPPAVHLSMSARESIVSPWSLFVTVLGKGTQLVQKNAPVLPHGSGPVRHIGTPLEFQQRVAESTERIAVVMFHAPDCKACQVAIPELPQMAHEFAEVADFYLMDVSENKAFCRELDVKVLPTFQILVMHEGKPGLLAHFACSGARCVTELRRKLGRFAEYDPQKYEF